MRREGSPIYKLIYEATEKGLDGDRQIPACQMLDQHWERLPSQPQCRADVLTTVLRHSIAGRQSLLKVSLAKSKQTSQNTATASTVRGHKEETEERGSDDFQLRHEFL